MKHVLAGRCAIMLACAGLGCAGLACGGGAAAGGPAALAEFGTGGPAPGDADLPLTLSPPDFSRDKALDVAVAFAFSGALWGLGALIRSARKGFKPVGLVGLGVALMAVFFTDTSFYDFKSVTADASGVTVARHVGGEARVGYADVTEVRVEPGRVFPVFTDDRALVLKAADGRSVTIPFFVPERDRLGSLLKGRIRL